MPLNKRAMRYVNGHPPIGIWDTHRSWVATDPHPSTFEALGVPVTVYLCDPDKPRQVTLIPEWWDTLHYEWFVTVQNRRQDAWLTSSRGKLPKELHEFGGAFQQQILRDIVWLVRTGDTTIIESALAVYRLGNLDDMQKFLDGARADYNKARFAKLRQARKKIA